MSDMGTCDKCHVVVGHSFHYIDLDGEVFDVCADCIEKIRNWLKYDSPI